MKNCSFDDYTVYILGIIFFFSEWYVSISWIWLVRIGNFELEASIDRFERRWKFERIIGLVRWW